MAFLIMDLSFHGRRNLARPFTAAYFREAGDEEGRSLLPFYTAYRAVVRAKVEGFELVEAEIEAAERDAALVRARAHWLLALGELEGSQRRLCLLLVGGLPGTGKSTLALGLAERADCVVIRSDLVRKELTGAGDSDRRSAPFAQGIYTPEWTKRTYAECLRRAEQALFEGRRVVVDATFREEWTRRAFLDAARRWAVPALLFLCEADPGMVRRAWRTAAATLPTRIGPSTSRPPPAGKSRGRPRARRPARCLRTTAGSGRLPRPWRS